MPDDFTKFERMKAAGASPQEIYLAAKSDGHDGITSIRLIRTVCGLSLREAKQLTGAIDVWSQKQNLEPGALVYWEGQTSEEGFYLMQARVVGIENGTVLLSDHKKFRPTGLELQEVPLNGTPLLCLPASYFEKPLAERVAEAIQFWAEIGHPHNEAV